MAYSGYILLILIQWLSVAPSPQNKKLPAGHIYSQAAPVKGPQQFISVSGQHFVRCKTREQRQQVTASLNERMVHGSQSALVHTAPVKRGVVKNQLTKLILFPQHNFW